MLKIFWDTTLYEPLVNFLAILVSVVPGGDVGVAVIVLTLLVKIALYPLSQRSIESQAKMSVLAPEINKIKAGGASKEEQAKQTFELYKKHKTNPFSGCLLVLIQIPIIFALYFVFLKGLSFNGETLYSFVKQPEHLNTLFLGVVDITQKSWVLAILAGVSQFFQAHFMPKAAPSTAGAGSFAESFSKSMHMQMKYVFPPVVVFIAYSISGAIALYWITSNLFAVGQQIYANKKNKNTNTLTVEAK